jgi:hypothetical protein
VWNVEAKLMVLDGMSCQNEIHPDLPRINSDFFGIEGIPILFGMQSILNAVPILRWIQRALIIASNQKPDRSSALIHLNDRSSC